MRLVNDPPENTHEKCLEMSVFVRSYDHVELSLPRHQTPACADMATPQWQHSLAVAQMHSLIISKRMHVKCNLAAHYGTHVLPSLLLRFLVRLINFLYLCFFIFSFLCLFTLIAYISGPLFSAALSRYSSNLSCLACRRDKKGCLVAKGMSCRWTKGPVEAEYSCSPEGRVRSVMVRVVVKCLEEEGSVGSASYDRSSCCEGSPSMGTGTGGVLNGLNCLTSSSSDGAGLSFCRA